jgi:hypothetical protein
MPAVAVAHRKPEFLPQVGEAEVPLLAGSVKIALLDADTKPISRPSTTQIRPA